MSWPELHSAVWLAIAPEQSSATLIGAAACLVYAYLLNAGLLMPRVATSSTLTVGAAVLCGLQGGLFYAFSTAVMLALARQPHPSGMAAMQTINVVVFNPWFGGAFSLAPVACALAMITALARWPAPETPWVVAGGAIFLIGTLAVTALCNVPHNDALDAMPATAQGARSSGRATCANGRSGITCEAAPRWSPPRCSP